MRKQIQVPNRFPWRTVNATPDRAWLTGAAFCYEGSGAGSAYFSNALGYSMPDGIASIARGEIPFPPNWGGRQARFVIAWRPANGSAGNVRFDTTLRRIKDNTSFAAGILGESGLIDATNTDTDKAVVTTVVYDAFPTDVTNGEFLQLAINRRGDVGADDTYAYTIYLIAAGLEIV